MAITFDENGVNINTLSETRQEIIDRANILMSPYSEGLPLLTDESSVLGRIISLTAYPAQQTYEIIPAIFNALDINSATDMQVDNIAKLADIYRKGASQSAGDVVVWGKVGTIIPEGSRVRNKITGDVFATTQQVTLDQNNAVGIDVLVDDTQTQFSLSYSINGQLSTSPEIMIQTNPQDNTLQKKVERIVDAINSRSSYLTASRNNDNTVRILIKENYRTGFFNVSNGLQLFRSHKQTPVNSLTYSSQLAEVNTITQIDTAILGWEGVRNVYTIFASEPVESDADLKYRVELKGSGNYGLINSLTYSLRSLRGVTYTNYQITKDGVYVTVLGGNDKEIAEVLFEHCNGVAYLGDIEAQVKDMNGAEHDVKFSRPKPVSLQLQASLIVSPTFPTDGIAKIKEAIVEWFNNRDVGEDIYYSRLYEPINRVRGFSIKNLKVGRAGGSLGLDDIIIRHNEIATISAENIYIGGQ